MACIPITDPNGFSKPQCKRNSPNNFAAPLPELAEIVMVSFSNKKVSPVKLVTLNSLYKLPAPTASGFLFYK